MSFFPSFVCPIRIVLSNLSISASESICDSSSRIDTSSSLFGRFSITQESIPLYTSLVETPNGGFTRMISLGGILTGDKFVPIPVALAHTQANLSFLK